MNKGEILERYIRLVRQLGGHPSNETLEKADLTRNTIRHHWGTVAALEAAARDLYDTDWKDAPLESMLSDKAPKVSRRYVVTTASVGCDADREWLAVLRRYAKANKAEIIVMVAADPASRRSPGGHGYLDKALADCHILGSDLRLNKNLLLSTAKMSAKQINPETGLSRITRGCAVYASPKQRHHTIPSNKELPRAIMTPGAVTLPNYATDLYMSKRTAAIAEADHVMGALVFEVESDEIFHVRQLQKGTTGGLVDINRRYRPDTGPKKIRAAALVLGDWHSGTTDDRVRESTAELARVTRPKAIVVHDLFDGLSINPHEQGMKITRAKQAKGGRMSLQKELEKTAEDLRWLSTLTDRVVVVRSNHDLFLDRYLESGRYLDEPENAEIGIELAAAIMKSRKGAVQLGVEQFKALGNVQWLAEDESLIIEGVELGYHGHRGPNGARGSIQNLEAALGSAVIGHSHTPGILRSIFAVGTSTPLKIGYNKGPSSWFQTHCLVHPGGGRQLISFINGKWRIQ